MASSVCIEKSKHYNRNFVLKGIPYLFMCCCINYAHFLQLIVDLLNEYL